MLSKTTRTTAERRKYLNDKIARKDRIRRTILFEELKKSTDSEALEHAARLAKGLGIEWPKKEAVSVEEIDAAIIESADKIEASVKKSTKKPASQGS